jgi:hypothetical protein
MIMDKQSLILLATVALFSATAFASGNPNVSLMIPASFQFELKQNDARTNCAKLNQLIQKYISHACLDDSGDQIDCEISGQLITDEAQTNLDAATGEVYFHAAYSIGGNSIVKNAPLNYSLNFDIAYTSNVLLKDIQSIVPVVKKLVTSNALSVAEKLNLSPGFSFSIENGPILQTNNRLFACALESGEASLTANTSLALNVYHPLQDQRFALMTEVYKKAHILMNSGKSLPAKEFLLGMAVGEAFRSNHYPVSGSDQTDDVALSVLHILMKDSNLAFQLMVNEDDAEQAARDLLAPQINTNSVPIEMRIKNVSQTNN